MFRLKIMKILLSNHIVLYKNILGLNDSEILLYLWNHMSKEEANLFYYDFIKRFPDTFLDLLLPYFFNVLSLLDFPSHFLYCCADKWGLRFVFSKLEKDHSLSSFQYREILELLYEYSEENKKMFRSFNMYLFLFYDAVKKKSETLSSLFLYEIIYPLLFSNCDFYFKTLESFLFQNNLCPVFLGHGSNSFVFDGNGLVIKFGRYRSNSPIFKHYRLNDFYVQKMIETSVGKIKLEVVPKGDIRSVTDQDVNDVLKDLECSNLIVKDRNVKENCAVFLEEPNLFFQDLDSVILDRSSKISESYQKKKVKLIDIEFIYDKGEISKS